MSVRRHEFTRLTIFGNLVDSRPKVFLQPASSCSLLLQSCWLVISVVFIRLVQPTPAVRVAAQKSTARGLNHSRRKQAGLSVKIWKWRRRRARHRAATMVGARAGADSSGA